MRLLSVIAAASVGLTAGSAVAAAAAPLAKDEIAHLREILAKQQEQLDRQAEENAKQREMLKQQIDMLESQKAQYDDLNKRIEQVVAPELPDFELERYRGAGVKDRRKVAAAGDAERTAKSPTEVGSARKPKEPERPPEIAAYIEEGGVLLPKGSLVVTPEIGYLNSSATRVAIEGFSIIPALNIGLFEVAELTRDTYTAAVGLRYGITNRFEVDMKIPYLLREDSTRNRPIGAGTSSDVLTSVSGMGIGDVEFGAHYQVNDGKEGWPYLIANMRFKSNTGTSPFDVPTDPATGLQTELPTGSGFMAFQPSVTAIYPTDPGVLYGNIGYLYNVGEDVGGTIGDIEPGDSVSASMGMSVALNDTSSFSFGYAHNTVFKTRQNGFVIPNSRFLQVGTLTFGYAQRITDDTSVNFNVNAGVTEDAPDVNVVARVPMRFSM